MDWSLEMKRKYKKKIDYSYMIQEDKYFKPRPPKDPDRASVWKIWKRLWRENEVPHERARQTGIATSIAPEWWSFERFYKDVGPRKNKMSLVRPDSTKPFGPDNFEWTRQRGGNGKPERRKLAYKVAVRLIAGKRPVDIARELDMPLQNVSNIANGRTFVAEMERAREALSDF